MAWDKRNNLNSLPKFTPSCLKVNHTVVTEKNKVANEFNHFLNSIATKIDAKIVKTESQFHESLRNPNEKTFFLAPTTTEEVEDHPKFWNDRKAIEINSIPTKILKTLKKYCHNLLLNCLI